jgi:riboflavin transporter FmnP
MTDLTQEQINEERETFMSTSSKRVIEISGAALFGAISIVFYIFTNKYLPRVPGWGIAIIDPVSIIWILCFLIFGTKSGLLCTVIGTLGMMPFDDFTPIGPLMKFGATVSLIVVPILFLKLYKEEEGVRNSQKIKKPRNYIIYGLFGVLLRIGVMMLFNFLLFVTLYSAGIPFVNLAFLGLPDISGWTAIVIGVIIINAETSLWDLIIPYVIVFGSKLDQWFSIW